MSGHAGAAVDAATAAGLLSEESSKRGAAIEAIAASGDPQAFALLSALRDGLLRVTPSGQYVIKERGSLTDALTGQPLDTEPDDLEKVTINNRLRAQVESAVAVLRILSKDPKERLAAARGIEPTEAVLPVISKALAAETDPEIREVLRQSEAAAKLVSTDPKRRLEAIAVLAEARDGKVKTLLQPLIEKTDAGE
jgi:urea transport system permease protein